MNEMKYVFGPVPSRRMGRSLGISPIPQKACNYSCVYCQLGRTNKMTNRRQEYFPLEDILAEFDQHHSKEENYDVVTIVGEGEPTLYSRLGELIVALKARTTKPVAVITNGALLYEEEVRNDLMKADLVLPSLDGFDCASFHAIDRPHGFLNYDEVFQGLVTFSHAYEGLLYLEIMLMDGINDDEKSLKAFQSLLKQLRYDRLYINTPIRPPAEDNVRACRPEAMQRAVEMLHGISIDMLAAGSFSSDIVDDYEAVLSIIGRHPMNQFEIMSFLDSRQNQNPNSIITRLQNDPHVEEAEYKGYHTYRLK